MVSSASKNSEGPPLPSIFRLMIILTFNQVCDYDMIGSGDPIGKVFLGWNQQKKYKPGFKHWKEVLENPRRPIIKWHVLQDPEPEEEEDDKV